MTTPTRIEELSLRAFAWAVHYAAGRQPKTNPEFTNVAHPVSFRSKNEIEISGTDIVATHAEVLAYRDSLMKSVDPCRLDLIQPTKADVKPSILDLPSRVAFCMFRWVSDRDKPIPEVIIESKILQRFWLIDPDGGDGLIVHDRERETRHEYSCREIAAAWREIAPTFCAVAQADERPPVKELTIAEMPAEIRAWMRWYASGGGRDLRVAHKLGWKHPVPTPEKIGNLFVCELDAYSYKARRVADGARGVWTYDEILATDGMLALTDVPSDVLLLRAAPGWRSGKIDDATLVVMRESDGVCARIKPAEAERELARREPFQLSEVPTDLLQWARRPAATELSATTRLSWFAMNHGATVVLLRHDGEEREFSDESIRDELDRRLARADIALDELPGDLRAWCERTAECGDEQAVVSQETLAAWGFASLPDDRKLVVFNRRRLSHLSFDDILAAKSTKEPDVDPNPPIELANMPIALLRSLAWRLACRAERPDEDLRSSPAWEIVPVDGHPDTKIVRRRTPFRQRTFTTDDMRMFMMEHPAIANKIVQDATTEPQEPTMTATILDTLKADATDAAYRTAGSQLVKLTRDPLAALLARHLAPGEDESLRGRVAEFLKTEAGTAIVAGLLSLGMSAAPVAGEVKDKLARELRVRSAADMGDLVAELLMGPLRTVIELYLRDVPAIVAQVAPLPAPAATIGQAHEEKIKVAVAK